MVWSPVRLEARTLYLLTADGKTRAYVVERCSKAPELAGTVAGTSGWYVYLRDLTREENMAMEVMET
jgi:hypothetical protein